MKHYKAQIKECGRDHILTPELIGDKTIQEAEEWFGVHDPDVEWYKIEEVEL